MSPHNFQPGFDKAAIRTEDGGRRRTDRVSEAASSGTHSKAVKSLTRGGNAADESGFSVPGRRFSGCWESSCLYLT